MAEAAQADRAGQASLLLHEVEKSPWIQAYSQAAQAGHSFIFEELQDTAKAFLCLFAQKACAKNMLILTVKSSDSFQLLPNLATLKEDSLLEFPAWETLPGEEIKPSADIVGARCQTLRALSQDARPKIISASLQACLQKVIAPKALEKLYLDLKSGSQIRFEKLIEQLVAMDYERAAVAADKGQFAVRGGIIDIFPVSAKEPVRLDFFGDEIESIKIYDPVSQRSIAAIGQIAISPADESELLKRHPLATLLDYLGPDTLLVFDGLEVLEEGYARLKSLGANDRFFLSIEDFLKQAKPYQSLYFTEHLLDQLGTVTPLAKAPENYYSGQFTLKPVSFEMFQMELQGARVHTPFESLEMICQGDVKANFFPALKEFESNYVLHITTNSQAEERHLKEEMQFFGDAILSKSHFYRGYLSSGFVLKDTGDIFFPYTELSKRYQIRRESYRHSYSSLEGETFELNPGEYIVHLQNGIGRYQGLTKQADLHGQESEYFTIEYAEGSKLFVPLQQAHQLSKYIGAKESVPKLHALGSTKWKKIRQSTEKAIVGYAKDLLETYANREIASKIPYPADSLEVELFEDEFPYQETEDQLKAILEIKSDLKEDKPMDRLVLGDVGYGKTEVAMRAAFKAVVDGKKQVAVLAPTTVLAMQHYETFLERMANFPIRIALLSRFSSAKQIKEALAEIREGKVDIAIGTHRLIGKDVSFPNLGLIIIDEEQRFGVKAKEHLKQMRSGVDCLTLSATPIPRTLYMSLIGIRQLSQISTPPQDRLPIKTIIQEPSDSSIKQALLRELSRGGQAYFIHNRVETIFEKASFLKKLLPESKVLVAHGQMHADEIEEVFHAFKKGQANILVATSLIENGIDIPNANTIIIDQAHQFGISALYQLRGRVGRWNRRAFAYLLIPRNQAMNEIARKRVEALAAATGYGGGLQVAMRDLELRGAGNLLGTNQSGHVSQIGFHLYCRLLKQAILRLQGSDSCPLVETKVETPFDARLPEDYVNDVHLRMDLYHRLGQADGEKELYEIKEEIQDRFGKLPLPARWLYQLSILRVFASRLGYSLLKVDKVYLLAERKRGSAVETKKFLLGKGKSPEDFTAQVQQILSAQNAQIAV